jgi:fructose-bisphosphate aldolase class I
MPYSIARGGEDEPMNHNLETITAMLIAPGKGILAADETVPTVTKRFDTPGIQSTEDSRRTYREMLFTAAGIKAFVSGVITYDETIRQKSAAGMPVAQVLASRGAATQSFDSARSRGS